jgi:aryl-alcohol dehydrogenase-like predicted oxidoreductase
MTHAIATLSGAPVSRLGLGCSRMGSLGNPATLADCSALVRAALDMGVNHFDTADIYGQGDSERAIGRGLRGRRAEAFVVTKFGKRFSAKMGLLRPFKPLIKPLLSARGAARAVVAQRGGAMREDFRPERLLAALDASLRRLAMDPVDAVLLHGPSATLLRDPALQEVLSAILAAGKARYVGVSVETGEELEAALALPACALLQIPISLLGPRSSLGGTDGRFVFAREIVRLQPDLAPAVAVARALARTDLDGVIVGTGSVAHLKQLASEPAG